MLSDRERLYRRAGVPRLVALARALNRLRSVVTVMNTGAHPDDEQNGMLAVMRFQHGMRVVVACSTRGEGGQNTLGPERLGALGLVRSREMEEAARVLDADVAWLGHGPQDPVHDFGFSKSGVDTLGRWGRERILERLVRAYRTYRPDIVIPTFLDVPGQHGHHRAMTEAAETALAMAADPAAFPEHAADGLSSWQVAKYYLPAWSGGGDTYDDEVPPPMATTWVRAEGTDPVTGASYDRIGEMSRAYHASQNMGFWRVPGKTDWPLHLKVAAGGAGLDEPGIMAGLPSGLADLAPLPELAAADRSISEALAAFPHQEPMLAALLNARQALVAAQSALSASLQSLHGHRLVQKLAELDAALLLAAGVDLQIAAEARQIVPGASTDLVVEHNPGLARNLRIELLPEQGFAPAEAALSEPRQRLPLHSQAEAEIRNDYRPFWHAMGGNGAGPLRLRADLGPKEAPVTVSALYDAEEPVELIPAHRVELAPEAVIIPLARQPYHCELTCRADTKVEIKALPGLEISPLPGDGPEARFALQSAPDLAAGRYSLPVTVAGAPALLSTPISYPHIGSTRSIRPVSVEVLALDLVLPESRIGLVEGGADNVGLWLERMGADVTRLDAAALEGDLSGFDTIVIGLFAFGTRPDLRRANARLKDWVRAGGHLVTLYHRPVDGWRGQETPPLHLSIGAPSLRWRVTNPAAPVTLLAPDHKLLAGPNRITAADFDGWDKERGLYFASNWDPAYEPLLSMSDAGEAPLLGSLLSAPVAAGRHTHTALVLHHQLDKLVPGAFRLLANLLQKA